MRASNGYRGLHELASGTRVVRVVAEGAGARNPPRIPALPGPPEAAGRGDRDARAVPGRRGRPLGAESAGPPRRGPRPEAPGLDRDAPKGSPPPRRPAATSRGDPAPMADRRRPSRRPMGCVIAPSGCPLADLAGHEGPSLALRPAALAEPRRRAGRRRGRRDAPGRAFRRAGLGRAGWPSPPRRHPSHPRRVGEPDPARAIRLLRQVAAIALEGGRRRADDDRTPIRAVVPVHALDFLARLTGGPSAFHDASEAAEPPRAGRPVRTRSGGRSGGAGWWPSRSSAASGSSGS